MVLAKMERMIWTNFVAAGTRSEEVSVFPTFLRTLAALILLFDFSDFKLLTEKYQRF